MRRFNAGTGGVDEWGISIVVHTRLIRRRGCPTLTNAA